jgi:hypothetical protein
MTFFQTARRKRLLTQALARAERCALGEGATFARTSARQIVETARVLAIADDEGGIPHVRYNCRIHRENRVFDDGPRTLALPSFLEHFETAE